MDNFYNEKMREKGYSHLVCDIFSQWEDVKDELLIQDRKAGSGNGTIHVFLGAADAALRKEFASYYKAVESGEDPSIGSVSVKHYFLKSNVLSSLGYVCQYYYSRGKNVAKYVEEVFKQLSNFTNEDGFLTTSSLLKLSTGSSKLRPYFKQFDSQGVFTKLIRQLLLPDSGYKISLYKNDNNEYAAFWLIGFDWESSFEADPNKEFFKRDFKIQARPSSLQQIYYGAPGTGKSHEIKVQTEGKMVIRTTFHPDSDYSTFVGAYKPTTVDEPLMTVIGTKAVPVENEDGSPRTESKIVYEFVEQAFLQAYIRAWKKYASALQDGNKPEEVFLVIEEINRGNCAQIFGDLFQLLDRGDDGFSEYPVTADKDLQKQLAKAFADMAFLNVPALCGMSSDEVAVKIRKGEILLLPNNLYIWATMNTSDQSLFPIDSAFKRRWDWQYVPISDAKKNWVIEVKGCRYDWWEFLQKINERVGAATNSEDKKLGYFFCKAKEGVIDAEKFVGKVVFYLWNDVFKDIAEEAGGVFTDDDGSLLSFNKFYSVGEDGRTHVVEEKVALFLQNLGLDVIEQAE